jgi:hypothetical protein
MTDPTSYLVRFASLDAAIAAHVESPDSQILEQRGDSLTPLQWDGEPAQQPCVDPAQELPCGEGVISYIARRLGENPPPCPSGWQPSCNLKMPAPARDPDQDAS